MSTIEEITAKLASANNKLKISTVEHNELKKKVSDLKKDLRKLMDTQQIKSFKNENGTFFYKEIKAAQVTNWELFSAYVYENHRLDLLPNRPTNKALEGNVPGVEPVLARHLNIKT